MAAIDFITVLGRLLRDGALRDAFATNPQAVAAQLDVRASDRAALLDLVPEDLEFQARVLLRKRLDAVRRVIPQTCRGLDAQAWPTFLDYARTTWPSGDDLTARDAFGFCRHLEQRHPGALCEAEWHRLRFALSKQRFAIHRVRWRTKQGKARPALQFFLRPGPSRWREWVIYFAV